MRYNNYTVLLKSFRVQQINTNCVDYYTENNGPKHDNAILYKERATKM